MRDPGADDPRLNQRVVGLFLGASIAAGWAIAVVQVMTLRWVPDCGGVAYGFPIPYLQTSMASSLEFVLAFGPLLIDWAVYAAVLTPLALACVRGLGRIAPAPGRHVVAGVLLTPWLTGACLGFMLVTGIWIPVFLHHDLKVHEWRTIRGWAGLPAWDTHLERGCN